MFKGDIMPNAESFVVCKDKNENVTLPKDAPIQLGTSTDVGVDDYKELLTALENFVKKQDRILYISDRETDLAPLIGALRCEILCLEKE